MELEYFYNLTITWWYVRVLDRFLFPFLFCSCRCSCTALLLSLLTWHTCTVFIHLLRSFMFGMGSFDTYIHVTAIHALHLFTYHTHSCVMLSLFFNISVMQPGVSLTYIRPQTLLARLLRYEHIASRSGDTSRWV